MMLALQGTHMKVAEFLLKHGADVNHHAQVRSIIVFIILYYII